MILQVSILLLQSCCIVLMMINLKKQPFPDNFSRLVVSNKNFQRT